MKEGKRRWRKRREDMIDGNKMFLQREGGEDKSEDEEDAWFVVNVCDRVKH